MKKEKLLTIGLLLLSAAWISLNMQKRPVIVAVTPESCVEKRIYRHCKDRYIANVLATSRRPYLYAAVASVESDYRPQIKGDKGQSIGMFQIQPKHHGHVPDAIGAQLRKAESILEPLIKKRGLEKGIAKYNGAGIKAKRYAKKVLQRERLIKEG